MTAAHRALCVLPHLPDRSTGGGILLYELLVFLAGRGTAAVVLPVEPRDEPALAALQSDVSLGRLTWHPLTVRRSGGMRGRLERLVSGLPAEVSGLAREANYRRLEELRRDVRPTVELLVSSWASSAYRHGRLPAGTRLAMVNVDPAIVAAPGGSAWRRAAAAIDRPKVTRLCRRTLSQAGVVGAISAADIPALERLSRRTDVIHVPPLMRPRPVDRGRVEPGTVLVTTNFSYPQNVVSLEWFFRECWPHVSGAARLTVTGRDADGRLAQLCGRQPRTIYAGCLDVAALDGVFARTAVAVNPTRGGSGFQIKLLDAAARGVPIVSTAFSNRLGSAIPASDDPGELAALITARLAPGAVPPLDYAAYHRAAVAAWEAFLFGTT